MERQITTKQAEIEIGNMEGALDTAARWESEGSDKAKAVKVLLTHVRSMAAKTLHRVAPEDQLTRARLRNILRVTEARIGRSAGRSRRVA